MSFAEPNYLFAIPGVILLFALIYWGGERRMQSKLTRFISGKLMGHLMHSYSLRRQIIKGVLATLAVVCFVLALARPQWGNTWEEVKVKGIDVLIALDTSKSMLAEDMAPNRLERAKLAIQDLLPQVEGNRVGLITFAGQSFLQCPLTLDYDAIRQTLLTVDTNSVPVGGTDIAAAIEDAELTFGENRNHKFLVIITDGEDLEAAGIQAARDAEKKGIIIYTVGVGSANGELIPISDANGNRGYLKDANGDYVKTAIDEMTLTTISRLTQGMYTRLGATGLDEVYQKALETIPPEEREEQLRKIPIERFQWPLGTGLLILFLEGLIGVRRRNRVIRVLTMGLLCLGLFGAGETPVNAEITESTPVVEATVEQPTPHKAYRSYKDEAYQQSATQYGQLASNDPEDSRLWFNEGDALYRDGRYDEAVKSYMEALKSENLELQADTFYNLGNTYHKLGEARFKESPKDTRLLWGKGIQYFKNATLLDEKHEDADYNLEKLSALLESILRDLTVEALPEQGGSVEGSGRFAVGETTVVKAKPNEKDGWRFDGWRGEGLSTPEKATSIVKVSDNMSVGAVFIKTWQLTVQVNDPQAGSAEKSGRYDDGTDTPIKATSNDHYTFDHWEGDGIADASKAESTVHMDADKTVTAVFVPAYELKLKVTPELAGMARTEGWYAQGSNTPIEYMAHDGWELDHWEGTGISDKESPQSSVLMDADKTVTVVAKRVKKVILYATPDQGGTVLGSCNADDGTYVDIEAIPEQGYKFTGWEGAGVEDPTELKTRYLVNGEADLFAHFESENDDQNNQNQNQNNDQNQDNNQDQNDKQQNNNQNQSSDQNQQDNSSKNNEQQENNSDNQDQQEQPQDQNQEQQDKSDSKEQSGGQDQGSDQQQPQDQQPGEEPQQAEEQQGQDGQEQEQPNQPESSPANEQPGQGAPEEPQGGSEGQEGEGSPMEMTPGAMTPTEAGQLLESMKDDEKKLPISILMGVEKKENTKGRDW
ncbi:MAG: VWA domain-containing protein [Opitutales bacterium]|nr:VWA domain-containing protein [Opitutales bacterium]